MQLLDLLLTIFIIISSLFFYYEIYKIKLPINILNEPFNILNEPQINKPISRRSSKEQSKEPNTNMVPFYNKVPNHSVKKPAELLKNVGNVESIKNIGELSDNKSNNSQPSSGIIYNENVDKKIDINLVSSTLNYQYLDTNVEKIPTDMSPYTYDKNLEKFYYSNLKNSIVLKILKKNEKQFNWERIVSEGRGIDENFIEMFKDKINWDKFLSNKETKNNIHILFKYKDFFGINNICEKANITDEFIQHFDSYINWDILSANASLCPELIEKYADKINWNNIRNLQYFSKEFIEKYSDKLDFILEYDYLPKIPEHLLQ